MQRGLVGSEMCIRDRVSTQSTWAEKNEVLKVSYIKNAEKGSVVEADKVLLLNDGNQISLEKSINGNSKVIMKVLDHKKEKKIIVFKKKRRKGYAKKQGHRQLFTEVLIAVSYTHLTLPTILLVQISVVAVSLKKKKKILLS
eukprot:TRINITY_DN14760_c0_g1_i1.p2 TRINITY_DN14760_c0_g1~~TRINITY_DN14760_c0_g1_i1.p2  ORF type:complete len:142 (+),score=59.28 TRINITY_DN14760_c0_g1_i1:103-528(+)